MYIMNVVYMRRHTCLQKTKKIVSNTIFLKFKNKINIMLIYCNILCIYVYIIIYIYM